MAQLSSSQGFGLSFTAADISAMAAVTATEVGVPGGYQESKYGKAAYEAMATSVVDAMVNRYAVAAKAVADGKKSPFGPGTMKGVLNQPFAFSAVKGPKGSYGDLSKVPAAPKSLVGLVANRVAALAAGAKSSIPANATHYANLSIVNPSWATAMMARPHATVGIGKYSHTFGNPDALTVPAINISLAMTPAEMAALGIDPSLAGKALAAPESATDAAKAASSRMAAALESAGVTSTAPSIGPAMSGMGRGLSGVNVGAAMSGPGPSSGALADAYSGLGKSLQTAGVAGLAGNPSVGPSKEAMAQAYADMGRSMQAAGIAGLAGASKSAGQSTAEAYADLGRSMAAGGTSGIGVNTLGVPDPAHSMAGHYGQMAASLAEAGLSGLGGKKSLDTSHASRAEPTGTNPGPAAQTAGLIGTAPSHAAKAEPTAPSVAAAPAGLTGPHAARAEPTAPGISAQAAAAKAAAASMATGMGRVAPAPAVAPAVAPTRAPGVMSPVSPSASTEGHGSSLGRVGTGFDVWGGKTYSGVATSGAQLSRSSVGDVYSYSPTYGVTTMSTPKGDVYGAVKGYVAAPTSIGPAPGAGLFGSIGTGLSSIGKSLSEAGKGQLGTAAKGALGAIGGGVVGSAVAGPVGGAIGAALGKSLATGGLGKGGDKGGGGSSGLGGLLGGVFGSSSGASKGTASSASNSNSSKGSSGSAGKNTDKSGQ